MPPQTQRRQPEARSIGPLTQSLLDEPGTRRHTVLPLLAYGPGHPREGQADFPAVPGLIMDTIRGVARLAESPFTGKINPLDVTNLAAPGVARAASPAGGGFGVFGGRGAMWRASEGKGTREAPASQYRVAENMERHYRDPRDIWQETGWYRGNDGKWRFEIPDTDAQLTPFAQRYATNPNAERHPDQLRLDDVIQHDKLFQAYPHLRQVRVQLTDQPNNRSRGSWYEDDNLIQLNVGRRNPDDALSTLIHEIQHAVQAKEGFAQGANPRAMGVMLERVMNRPEWVATSAPARMYRHAMGEVEARNVAQRMEEAKAAMAFGPELQRAFGMDSPEAMAAAQYRRHPMETQDVRNPEQIGIQWQKPVKEGGLFVGPQHPSLLNVEF